MQKKLATLILLSAVLLLGCVQQGFESDGSPMDSQPTDNSGNPLPTDSQQNLSTNQQDAPQFEFNCVLTPQIIKQTCGLSQESSELEIKVEPGIESSLQRQKPCYLTNARGLGGNDNYLEYAAFRIPLSPNAWSYSQFKNYTTHYQLNLDSQRARQLGIVQDSNGKYLVSRLKDYQNISSIGDDAFTAPASTYPPYDVFVEMNGGINVPTREAYESNDTFGLNIYAAKKGRLGLYAVKGDIIYEITFYPAKNNVELCSIDETKRLMQTLVEQLKPHDSACPINKEVLVSKCGLNIKPGFEIETKYARSSITDNDCSLSTYLYSETGSIKAGSVDPFVHFSITNESEAVFNTHRFGTDITQDIGITAFIDSASSNQNKITMRVGGKTIRFTTYTSIFYQNYTNQAFEPLGGGCDAEETKQIAKTVLVPYLQEQN